MKRLFPSLCLALFCLGSTVLAQPAADDSQLPPPETVKEQGSYGIGLQIGQNLERSLKAQKLDVSPEMIARGILDALMGKKPALSNEQIAKALAEFNKQAEANRQNAGASNLERGQSFLAANEKKPGVTALPSGLQYKVLKKGTGESPKATDRVRTHYHGTLIDGTVFDSSVERNEPAEFPVNQVIAGWTEALQLMKVGGKWQLFVPSDLAYGEQGAGGVIGPNATLIFEVELLDIVD